MTVAEQSFISAAVPAAQASQKQYGVPACITIAQAILESGWGKSQLAVQANNYFGIKAASGAASGSYVAFQTKEFEHGVPVSEMANFAKYPTMAAGFAAHAQLLATLPRYAGAMKNKLSPMLFAEGLKAGGYSTRPDYPQALMQLVEEFHLAQYDVLPEAVK